MSLSQKLISQFVKITNDKKEPNGDKTLYGTIKMDGATPYVLIDGADNVTPLSTTMTVGEGDRVTLIIKNHNVVVTGNLTNPAAKDSAVQEVVVLTGNLDADVATLKDNVNDLIANVRSLNIDNDTNKTNIDNIFNEIVDIKRRLDALEGK